MKHWRIPLVFLAITLWVGAALAQNNLTAAAGISDHRGRSLVVEVGPGQDDDVPSNRGWDTHNPCHGTASVLTTHSAHPGGNLGGYTNQRNGGWGGLCYLNEDQTLYYVIVGIHNSQHQNALWWAYGWRLPLLELDLSSTRALRWLSDDIRVRLFIGAEGGLLYYERRPPREAVTGPAILPHMAASIKFGKRTEITFMQTFLPDGVRLWGNVIQVPKEYSGNRELFPYRQDGMIAKQERFRPMLVLRYQF